MDIETDDMDPLCKLATIGYDLDGGGYAFEPGADDWLGYCVLDSGVDYLHWCYEGHKITSRIGGHSMVCVFDVHASDDHMPLLACIGDRVYVKLHAYTVHETDHDCNCHGRPLDPDVVTAAPDDWEWTGNTMDEPYPNCDRCEGEGYVISPGGVMAFYATIDRVLQHFKENPITLAGFLHQRSAYSAAEGIDNEPAAVQVAIDALKEGRTDVLPILSANRE